MITLRKYLYAAAQKRAEKSEPGSIESLFRFSSTLLDAIHSEVLVGDGCDSFRSQLIDLRDSLRPDWRPDEESAAESTAKRVLSEYRTSVQQSAAHQAIEIQQIFATLNQALIVMSEGKDRTVSRLNTIQDSLRQASMIDDIVALKSALTATVEFIKREAAHAHEVAAQEIGQFSTQLSQAREFVGNTQTKLPGRAEGIKLIAEFLGNQGDATFLLGYRCDRLQAVAERYGPPIAEELVFHMIKERVRPITPQGAVFRWTSSSTVTVFRSATELTKLRSQVTELNRTPLMHRICLGGRTAVLTMDSSRLIAQGIPGEAGNLVKQTDRFAQIDPSSGI